MALHYYLSCRFVIYCDPIFIEDCSTVVVTEGADGYEGVLKAWKDVCFACFVW